MQAITDKDRANISLSYHCVSLTDVYWVRIEGEGITFAQLNLYDNPLNEAIVELSLKGRQMTVTNKELAPDLSTKGCFPKAWIREKNGFLLLKDGGEETVRISHDYVSLAISHADDLERHIAESLGGRIGDLRSLDIGAVHIVIECESSFVLVIVEGHHPSVLSDRKHVLSLICALVGFIRL